MWIAEELRGTSSYLITISSYAPSIYLGLCFLTHEDLLGFRVKSSSVLSWEGHFFRLYHFLDNTCHRLLLRGWKNHSPLVWFLHIHMQPIVKAKIIHSTSPIDHQDKASTYITSCKKELSSCWITWITTPSPLILIIYLKKMTLHHPLSSFIRTSFQWEKHVGTPKHTEMPHS